MILGGDDRSSSEKHKPHTQRIDITNISVS